MINRFIYVARFFQQVLFGSFFLFLVGSQFAVAQSALEVVKSPLRTDQDRSMDEKRKPQEMLNFIQVKPGMVALDIFSAGGYTAQLMALAVGPSGKAYAFNIRAFPALEERLKERPQTNLISVVGALNELLPAMDGQIDVITIINSYHDLVNLNPDIQTMNQRLHALLKPGGMLIIRDHAAKEGTGKSVTKTLHRIESASVVADFESIGFKKVAEGDFLKNPQDSREEHSNKGNPPEGFIIKLIKR
jgi:SAM-dependent methyltransferase